MTPITEKIPETPNEEKEKKYRSSSYYNEIFAKSKNDFDGSRDFNQRDENFNGSIPTSELIQSYQRQRSRDSKGEDRLNISLVSRKSSIKRNQKTIH